MKKPYVKPLSIILILGLGLLAYSNSFFCSFHFDDARFIVSNLAIKNLHNIQGIWDLLPCRFILYLSLAINYYFGQLNVLGYHLVNVTVHLISALLVWWLVLLTLRTPALKDDPIARHAPTIALLTALIFVTHPIQTQAVTYIIQRAASMSTMFYLLSLCLYAKSGLLRCAPRHDRHCERSEAVSFIASLFAAVLAMFTKETAITLPLIVLTYEFYFLNNKKNINWKHLAPFLATALIIPITMFFTAHSHAVSSREMQMALKGHSTIPAASYLITEFRVIITYIRLSFIPIHQNLVYDYPIYKSILNAPVLFSLLTLGTVLYFAKRLFLKYRLVSFGIIWFFITLLPESSIFPIDIVIFEHRLYLPMVGFCIFGVSGLYYLSAKRTLKVMIALLAAVIGINSFLTYQRNKIWATEISLWNDVVTKSPHKERPYVSRGLAFTLENDIPDAIADFDRAIDLNPSDDEAYNNRGMIYGNQNQFPEAMADFNKAIQINPQDAQAYNNRAFIFAVQGDFANALREIKKAIALDPDYADAYYNLGKVYNSQGNLKEAVVDYSKAIRLNPDDAKAHNNRGTAYFQQGDITDAIADYTKAIALKGDFEDAYYNRGLALYKEGRRSEAIADFTQALKLNPNDTDASNNLAKIKG